MSAPTFEPTIIGYLCTWCSYTGADTAGIARLKYPANMRAVRVPCSGRVSPELIMRAFDEGADGVLVLGCHLGECHYDTGNHRTAKRVPPLQALLAFAGLEPERLRLDWVSASEAERFARIVDEFTETVRGLGPARWRVKRSSVARVQSPVISHQLPTISHQPSAISHQPSAAAQAIQAKARQLLSSGEVECVIGYEVGPRGWTRPAFVYQADDADRLAWNQGCAHNLATYLREKLRPARADAPRKRVAVVAKPCDARAINVLLAESQFAREQVHVIGVECEGMVEGDGRPQARCEQCEQRTPALYDTLVGNGRGDAPERLPSAPERPPVEGALAAATPAERMEFWLSQFDRCLRCYACRQACPLCSCPTCLYEREDSLWVGLGLGLNEKRTFHLGRAYHLAGRCVGCNACEQACPMNIPISLLNRRLAAEIEARFGPPSGDEPCLSPLVTVLGPARQEATP